METSWNIVCFKNYKIHLNWPISKADTLMFHHVCCDLVMLAKSTSLNKNVLGMNKHYVELQSFLSEVESYSEA